MLSIITNLNEDVLGKLIAGLAMILALTISLTMHEYAHAFVAYKQGDDTAKLMGRLTPNPIAHIDLFGFLCCIFFGFGWAKPVPINPLKFRKFRKGIALVSLAGITVNFIFAFIFGGFYVLCSNYLILSNYFNLFLYDFCLLMFSLNCCLCVFNLLPIYPLDGFNFLQAFTSYENKFMKFMQNYGFIILLLLLFVFDFALSALIEMLMVPIQLFWGLFF